MPISITPSSSPGVGPVTLVNTLGYSVEYQVKVTTCTGKLVSVSRAPLTLPTNTAAVSKPASNAPRLVTFTARRANAPAAAGIQAQVSLTARQGCPAAAAAAARPAPLPPPTAPVANAGVAVAPAHSNLPVIAIVAGVSIVIVVAITVVLLLNYGRRPARPRGSRGSGGHSSSRHHRGYHR